MTLSRRLYGLAALSMCILIGALWFSVNQTENEIKTERRALLSAIDDTAIRILSHYQALEESGALSRQAAQSRAVEAIEAIRYGQDGYVWINDLNSVIIMHPTKPELDGKDASGMKDPTGKYIFKSFVEVAKANGSGFVDYMWPKPGFDKPMPKLSHVALFKPWGWVVGNGVYIDDLQARVNAIAAGEIRIAFAAVAVMLFAAFWIIRSVTGPINGLRAAMQRIAGEDFAAEIVEAKRHDEIGQLAKGLSDLRDSVNERVQSRLAEQERQRELIEAERLENERLKAVQAANLAEVVDKLGAGLNRLADCNIRMTIDQPFAEEFETMRADFNNSIAAFQGTLEEVLAATRELADHGQAMHDASDAMAQRTEQQAAALEETSASLEEITATVRSTADRTKEARHVATQARGFTQSSTEVVRRAVQAMADIEQASGQIGEIIDVVDQIAFQTNLLALNAGVEAARAGDAGKGFAVVAQEVRELAQKTGEAARNIKSLVSKSAVAVETGVDLVSGTGDALAKIEEQVVSLDGLVGEIATASEEQSSGLSQITAAVATLDQMTQRNAAMALETSRISRSLTDGAERLSQLVARFKLNRRAAIRQQERQTVRAEIRYDRAA